jgi:hypothetical protein
LKLLIPKTLRFEDFGRLATFSASGRGRRIIPRWATMERTAAPHNGMGSLSLARRNSFANQPAAPVHSQFSIFNLLKPVPVKAPQKIHPALITENEPNYG